MQLLVLPYCSIVLCVSVLFVVLFLLYRGTEPSLDPIRACVCCFLGVSFNKFVAAEAMQATLCSTLDLDVM